MHDHTYMYLLRREYVEHDLGIKLMTDTIL